MQGSSFRDQCVIERGQHDNHEEIRASRRMTGNCLQFRVKFEKQLLVGAKLQFRKCLLFPEGGASKRPRGGHPKASITAV